MNAMVIVQARLGSTRFPRKVLADLCGKPVIQHVVERALAIRGVQIVITACPATDRAALWDFGLPFDRGLVHGHTSNFGEVDVLGRFLSAVERWRGATSDHRRPPFEGCGQLAILRVTADCPFLSPQLAERVLSCVKGGAYYACTRHDGGQSSWPDGLDVEAFTADALCRADREARPEEREHVTAAMRRILPADKQEVVPCPSGFDWPEGVKLSIDTPADLDYAREVMGRIIRGGNYYGAEATYEAVMGREFYAVPMGVVFRREGE